MKISRSYVKHGSISWLISLLVISCGSGNSGGRRGGNVSDVNPRQVGSGDGEASDGTDGSGDQSGGDNQAQESGDDSDVEQVFIKAGMRNYSQINATMSLLTGVPRSNATVSQVFTANLTTALPTDNDIKSFLGSQQVAVFKLAVEYCDAMVKDANISRAFFGSVTVTGAPSAVFSAQGKTAVADVFVSKFWGKNLESLPAHDQNVAMAVGLIDQLLANKDQNSAAVTLPVLTGTCAGILSSAPVTMY
jgi:hypothetical protein